MPTMTRYFFPAALAVLSLSMLTGPKACDDDPATDDPPPASDEATEGEAPSGDATQTDDGALAEGVTPAPGDDVAGEPTGGGEATGDSPAPSDGIAGTWHSESCGKREYAREMVFLDGGTYVRFDLVSPCPPGAQCIWSGILNFRGGWTFDGTAIALNDEQQVGSAGGGDSFGPGPRKLIYQADPLRLLNPLASGTCEYAPADPRDVSAALKMKPAP